MMGSPDNPAFPKGSTILVTGANGFLGSHIADQFLSNGYEVCGTVRDCEKNAWLVDLFKKRHPERVFKLVKVSDLTAEGAFTEALKGVSAVVHTASVVTFEANPHNVIPTAIDGAVNALKAAYKEASVKRFVFTSSSTAAVGASLDQPGVLVTEDTWNQDAIAEAWAEPPYGPDRIWAVYAASKAQAEQEVWRFHCENRHQRPDFVVNSVLPAFNFGPVLDPTNQGFPNFYVDVRDTAALHLAAAVFPHIKDRRIFGFAGHFNWDLILEILRKNQPDKTFPSNFSDGIDPNEIQPCTKPEQLLHDLGRPGWISLEESILDNVQTLRSALGN
ncbi:aldehyde reductase [Fusarium pseudocircinatum]|uniref:Aldehyde reductase n=1 Tax=Fusarium pseudocircinatum TaxID=56676 RepID=A0A8H5KFD6_9HYPO|nr:aldehyde reductase [Fusarium pseudocircinatum]